MPRLLRHSARRETSQRVSMIRPDCLRYGGCHIAKLEILHDPFIASLKVIVDRKQAIAKMQAELGPVRW